MNNAAAHSTDSSLREQIIEHLFIGELMRHLWCQGNRDIEVLKAEVDRAGYDLVIESNGVLRHIQLKASKCDAKTNQVNINVNLADKPSGCVIWIWFNPDTMEFNRFLWFGSGPGLPLPPLGSRIGRHTKGDKDGAKKLRPNIRVLVKSSFNSMNSIDEVAKALFGEPELNSSNHQVS